MPKPVIFVPGFPASELWRESPRRMIFPPGLDDIATPKKREKLIELLCNTGATNQLVAGQPIRRVMMIAKQADSLYELLRGLGYTIESGNNFRAIGWDWRLGVDHPKVQADLRAAITELKAATGQKPVVLLHSTGGLVFRHLIDNDATVSADIEQVLAFGVPWAGNLKALRYLTIGESIGFLTAKLSATQVRTIMRAAKAAYQLCPPDPARTVLQSANGKAFRLVVDQSGKSIAPLRSTSWMPANDSSVQELAGQADMLLGARTPVVNTSVPITNVCGWGLPTETTCTINASDVQFEETDQGDGTVAYVSSSWIRGTNVRTLSLPIGVTVTDQIPDPHSQLWNAEAVRQILREVLQDGQRAPFIHAAVDNDDSLDRNADVRIRIAASTELGEQLPNVRAVLHVSPKREQEVAMNDTRLTVKLKRGPGTRANFGARFFRFRVDVKWDGGAREIPLLIRA